MNIPNPERQRIAAEMRLAVDKMRHSPDHLTKLYYFSAAFGETGRTLNYAWDGDMALIHLVLQAVYNGANGRLQASAEGRERPLTLPAGFFEAAEEALRALANTVENQQDDEIPKLLARFSELAYLTTGNGYYLYGKGLIKL